MGQKLSVIGQKLSVIGVQLSAIGPKLSVIGPKLSVGNIRNFLDEFVKICLSDILTLAWQ